MLPSLDISDYLRNPECKEAHQFVATTISG